MYIGAIAAHLSRASATPTARWKGSTLPWEERRRAFVGVIEIFRGGGVEISRLQKKELPGFEKPYNLGKAYEKYWNFGKFSSGVSDIRNPTHLFWVAGVGPTHRPAKAIFRRVHEPESSRPGSDFGPAEYTQYVFSAS